MSSSSSLARLAGRVLAGATEIRHGEARAVLASGLLFFLVLSVVMILRPVREAMGLAAGIERVHWLFLATVASTLAVVPVFGYLVSRLARRVFLAVSFRVCALVLLGFWLCLTLLPAETHRTLGAVYYVFHSVFNLFLVSLFWAFMADLFAVWESKRLFPAIAVGGTLGAIAGSLAAGQLAGSLGAVGLFLPAAGLLELAVWTARLVARTRSTDAHGRARLIGGHALAGITAVFRSPYVLGIGLLIVLTATVSTFLYFTELRIVEAAAESIDRRAALFAHINLCTQVATLLAQALIAGRIMRYLGVGAALAVLPVYTAVGFALLAATPTLAVYTVVNALHKAIQRGIVRPARETLFTVLHREEKYKAKSFLDTFAFRSGDAGGAQIERSLAVAGFGLTGLAVAVLPIALVSVVLALWLGAAQSRLAAKA